MGGHGGPGDIHRTGDMGRQEGAQKSLAISCLVWRRANRLIGWTAVQMQVGAGQNARLGRGLGNGRGLFCRLVRTKGKRARPSSIHITQELVNQLTSLQDSTVEDAWPPG